MRLLATLALLFVVGCSSQPTFDPNYPQPELEGKMYCPQACARAKELSCKVAETTPHGKTCEDVCRKYTPPSLTGWRPACMTKAASCKEIDDCSY